MSFRQTMAIGNGRRVRVAMLLLILGYLILPNSKRSLMLSGFTSENGFPKIGTLAYAQPIVEHTFARQRALDTYKRGIN